MEYYLAVDIGATSGRHILGHLEDGKIVTEEVYRFSTHSTQKNSKWVWECEKLFENVVKGMKICAEKGKIPRSVSIDTWGADFVLLDSKGGVLGDAADYRDEMTLVQMMFASDAIIPTAEYYGITGIGKMPFDTIYQLMAMQKLHPGVLEQASKLMMIPSFLNYRLTGRICEEYTNAVTTGLVNARTKAFDAGLIGRMGFPAGIFSELHASGEIVGGLTDEVRKEVGYDCRVVLAPSHDTTAAFLASPASSDDSVTVSSGTWSILGIENDAPTTTPEALMAGFTNEGTYAMTYRLSKNIIGMFILEYLRAQMGGPSYGDMIAMAENAAEIDSVIDLCDLMKLVSQDMKETIRKECETTGQTVPKTDGELLRVFFRSLAVYYARTIKALEKVTGRKFTSVHIVGGGSKNGFVNELTRKETGLKVYAGPDEATVAGNLMCQMLSFKVFADAGEAKKACARSFEIKSFG